MSNQDKPVFAPATGRWIPFSERFPDQRPAIDDPSVMVRAHVMVTNNITAVDRAGRPSHVWWLCPQIATTNQMRYKIGEVIGLDEGDMFVTGLTHWFDPFAGVSSGS